MDESVGKGPGVENEVWQSLPKLDASGVVADDFARAADQAMTSSSADTAKDEPSQAAPEPTRDGILPRSSTSQEGLGVMRAHRSHRFCAVRRSIPKQSKR